MLCKEFETMTPKERTEYIGQLLHACMNDSECYRKGQVIIWTGEAKGLFQGVVINPPSTAPEINNDKTED